MFKFSCLFKSCKWGFPMLDWVDKFTSSSKPFFKKSKQECFLVTFYLNEKTWEMPLLLEILCLFSRLRVFLRSGWKLFLRFPSLFVPASVETFSFKLLLRIWLANVAWLDPMFGLMPICSKNGGLPNNGRKMKLNKLKKYLFHHYICILKAGEPF